jgi:hypothetical protein
LLVWNASRSHFTRRQIAAIHREARRRNTSDAAIVRAAIDAWLPGVAKPQPVDWISRARSVGQFSSGRRDVSHAHDRELSDAFDR